MKRRKTIVKVNRAPEGLFYLPNFLNRQDESAVVEKFAELNFNPYDHHGFIAKREIVHYGGASGYKVSGPEPTGPMPEWLETLRRRCMGLIELSTDEVALTLVAHYPAGAGIGWHRDAPQFGPTVIGASFGSTAVMRFRRFIEGDVEELFRINLAPGSAYIMSGPARSVWQHSLAPVSAARYSITFRTRKDAVTDVELRQTPEQIEKRLVALELQFATSIDREDEPQQLLLW